MASSLSSNTNDRLIHKSTLIWLDINVNSKENKKALRELCTISSNVEKFHDKKEFQWYIEQITSDNPLIIIVSGQLGREIVPSIHKRRDVESIYIYCRDKEGNEKWASKFPKVK